MKWISTLLFLLCSINLFAAQNLTKHLDKPDCGGLKSIIKKRYFRVLTTRNAYDYYIYQGNKKGIQFEMVKQFTKYLNKKYIKKGDLKIVFEMVPVDFDQLIPMLNSCKGDLIAVGMTRTPERNKLVRFTVPYRNVNEVVVTRKELAKEPWKGKTFHVQKNSSFFKSLSRHDDLVNVEEVDPNLNAGQMMEFISLKKYDYTLVNSFWADTLSRRFENLAIIKKGPFRKNIKISWAVRKKSNKLLKDLNRFLPKVRKGSLLGNLFSYKYFHDLGRIESAHFSLKDNRISKYDDYFKKYGTKFSFDWRLLAGVAFQESQFKQNIKNRWGAIGLFQIKQMTANEPYIGIKNISGEKNFENNIHAGAKYLSWIRNRYFGKNEKMSNEDKVRMTLAAYNAGPSRVLRAIKKAKNMKLNPNKWFRNVELAMMRLGYHEPVTYVSEINKHYVSYLLLGIK